MEPTPKQQPLDHFAGDMFTYEERQRLRRLLPYLEKQQEADERVAWLWAGARRWSKYIVATVVGVALLNEHITTFFRWIARLWK